MISSKIDWFDFLAFQGTLKSILQHHSLKTLLLQCSTFFTAQLSHPYMTTGKTIALTIWTLVGQVLSLLFNTQSRFVSAFLPRSNNFLSSWLQLPSVEPKKKKAVTTSPFSPSICYEVKGLNAMILVFFKLGRVAWNLKTENEPTSYIRLWNHKLCICELILFFISLFFFPVIIFYTYFVLLKCM